MILKNLAKSLVKNDWQDLRQEITKIQKTSCKGNQDPKHWAAVIFSNIRLDVVISAVEF